MQNNKKMPASPTLREVLGGPLIRAAIELLGCELVTQDCSAQIVEVEAYGPDDPGCHAFRGVTPRNQVMFGPPGHAYVYFTYGMHWLLNVTAQPEGVGAAILIRAAKPTHGIEEMRQRRPKSRHEVDLLSGPAKLAQAMGVHPDHYGLDLLDETSPIRIRQSIAVQTVLFGTRIGLGQSKGADLPWRFVREELSEWRSATKAPLAQMPPHS